MKNKIGIAISLYNKFEELGVLIDIIRKNWKNKYFISVCSNYPNAQEYIKGLDIDTFVQGECVKTDDMPNLQKSINMGYRVIDCIKKSCSANEADYVMHLHTDAWAFDENEIIKIVNHMEKNSKEVAFRGMGFSKYRHDCPLGHVDDMFFIYKRDAIEKKRFFEFNTLSMMFHKLSIHGILSTLLIAKIGLENVYQYENHAKQVFWDGKLHPGDLERARPSMFDPERKMLHVDTNTFPNNLGKRVQAMYLFENGVTMGENIGKFLEKYNMDKETLLKRLSRIETLLDWRLRFCGFPILSFGRFGRNFSKKIKYLKKPRISYVINSTLRSIWDMTIKKLTGVELVPDYSFWSESFENFMANNTGKEDYPDSSVVWFKKTSELKKIPKYYTQFYKMRFKGMV